MAGRNHKLKHSDKSINMKNMYKNSQVVLAAAAALFVTTVAQAQLISADIGSSAPSVGQYDQYQLSTGNSADFITAGGSYQDSYSAINSATEGGSYTPGSGYSAQTFTTPAAVNGGGFELNSISLAVVPFSGPSPGAGGSSPVVYNLGLYQVSGTSFTELATYTVTSSTAVPNNEGLFQNGYATSDWATIGGINQVLQPNTMYAYAIGAVNGGDYSHLSITTSGTYAGGTAAIIPPTEGLFGGYYQYFGLPTVPGALFASANAEATFDAALTPVNGVPEPSTIALGVMGAAALLFRRLK